MSRHKIILSILIVNFNGRDFLASCLNSIYRHVNISSEIIFFDNASEDDSVKFIKERYPEVKIINNDTNIGFSCGNNIAAKYAKGKYILLLNNDTIIQSTINPLIKIMDSNIDIGVLGCRLLYPKGQQQESMGHIPNILNIIFSWTPLAKIFPRCSFFQRVIFAKSELYKEKFYQVGWVSGAFLLTKATLWYRLGGLDEQYFMYMEDVDYCRRVLEDKNLVVFSSLCKVTHLEGSGRPWLGEKAILNTVYSYLIYAKKFYGLRGQFFLRIMLAPVFFIRAIIYLIFRIFKIDSNGYHKAKTYFHASFFLAGL